MTNADELSLATWRALAEAVGLDALTDEQVAALGRATQALRRHIDRLPGNLAPEAEPALVFIPSEFAP